MVDTTELTIFKGKTHAQNRESVLQRVSISPAFIWSLPGTGPYREARAPASQTHPSSPAPVQLHSDL
jgi:hypothetical protein